MENLISISNEKIINQKRVLLQRLLDSEFDISKDYILKKKWTCVLVEDNMPTTDEDIVGLLNLSKSYNNSFLWGILVEKVTVVPKLIKFETTKADYEEFMSKCNGFSYLIIDDLINFAILCTHCTYHIIGAQKQSILNYFNKDIEEVFQDYNNVFNFVREPERSEVQNRIVKYRNLNKIVCD